MCYVARIRGVLGKPLRRPLYFRRSAAFGRPHELVEGCRQQPLLRHGVEILIAADEPGSVLEDQPRWDGGENTGAIRCPTRALGGNVGAIIKEEDCGASLSALP